MSLATVTLLPENGILLSPAALQMVYSVPGFPPATSHLLHCPLPYAVCTGVGNTVILYKLPNFTEKLDKYTVLKIFPVLLVSASSLLQLLKAF